MKIKLDENIPASLREQITVFGHDVDTVISEGIAGHDDADVWHHATDANRFWVTQDLDFSDIRRFTPGHHPGILLVRLRDPSRSGLGGQALDLSVSAVHDLLKRALKHSFARIGADNSRQTCYKIMV